MTFDPKEARALVNEYDRQNPIRTADVHDSLCTCTRCLRDALTAALDEIERLRRAADVSATIANGALDPTAQEACLRRDMSRVRDHLRKALKGADQ